MRFASLTRRHDDRGAMRKLGTVAIVLLIALGLLVAVAACGGGDEEATVSEGNGGDKEEVAKVGDTMSLEGTTYKVTKVKTAPYVGSALMKAAGVFVIVNLTLTNDRDEPATISQDFVIRLEAGNGDEYTVLTEATMAVDDSLKTLDEIQPGVSKKVVLVYDVPVKAVKGSVLLVKDFWSDSEGRIKLGL